MNCVLISYSVIYFPEERCILKKNNLKNPKIRPQSESVMSAQTIIQGIRHGTHVYIYI